MSLEKFDPNNNQYPKVDPKYAREVVGPVGPSAGRSDSGSSARPSYSKPREETSGLDALYGKQAREFVFEGETFRLIRTGHNGVVTKDFLTATHITPRNIPQTKVFNTSYSVRDSDRSFWKENMKELHNMRLDASNNFFVLGVVFLDKEPQEEMGLSIRRAMISWINKGFNGRYDSLNGVKDFLLDGIDIRIMGIDHEARELGEDLEYYMSETFGKPVTRSEKRHKGGLAGFFGAEKTVEVPDGKRYDKGIYPSIVGTEVRFYYGQGDAPKGLVQRDQASPTSRPTTGNAIVLRREDLG